MTMLSDEELAGVIGLAAEGLSGRRAAADAIRAHIDALTAQRDRARSIAVSLEQELAEVQRLAKTVDGLRNVFGVKS